MATGIQSGSVGGSKPGVRWVAQVWQPVTMAASTKGRTKRMAGGLKDIVTKHGEFTMENIVTIEDAARALRECFDVLGWLDDSAFENACEAAEVEPPACKPCPGSCSES